MSLDGRASEGRIEYLDTWRTLCGGTQRAALLAAAGLTLDEAILVAPTLTQEQEQSYATLAALQGAFNPDARLLSLA